MLRIVLVLAAMVMLGCNSTESDNGGKVVSGVYQATLSGTGGNSGSKLTLEEGLGSDGAYRGRAFLNDGAQSCLIIEGNGFWAVHEKGFSTKNMRVKTRGSCEDELSTEENIPDDLTEIRNVTSTGFEEYFEGNNQPAQWVTFKKI